jgi:hypothetical protein
MIREVGVSGGMSQLGPSPDTGAASASPAGPHLHSFDTPGPVALSVEMFVGTVEVTATDRSDTVVEVTPSHPGRQRDVAAAEQTTVERSGDLIAVRGPHRWTRYVLPWAGRESVDVRIALPARSELQVEAGMATVRCRGCLGSSRLQTGFGEVVIEEAGPLQVRTGFGDLRVGRATGRLDAKTGSGAIRIGAVEGDAVARNSNGHTWIGEVSGELEVRAASGRIEVERALAAVTARTAHGDIRLGEVSAGPVSLKTSMGRIEVGVKGGVAAWLDLQTGHGEIRSLLEEGEPPRPGEASVEIRGRTAFGDITIRRVGGRPPEDKGETLP